MIVNANWLKKNINNKNIKIIDASWYLPNSSRDSYKEYIYSHIPNAVFFDIDKICEKNTTLPHMVPVKKVFETEVSKLGICSEDTIIVYCKDGVKTSPRVWWMFKYFGHKNIFILDGGFRGWQLVHGEQIKIIKKNKSTTYKVCRINKRLVITYELLHAIFKDTHKYTIIDGRPAKRFEGKDTEPRANIGKGIIPGSINIPYDLLQLKGFLKRKSSLKQIFKKISFDNKQIICSCGSGVNACNLAISLQKIGFINYTVYDGSWTEWYLRSTN